MYLRHTTVRKNGKTHTYWRLVRSARVGPKVHQETVACLGELNARGRARARALTAKVCGRPVQGELFEEPCGVPETVTVRVGEVRVERGRRFGDVWLGWRLWRALELDGLLERLLPCGEEGVPWPAVAAVLVLARLCEPSSELHIAEDWFRQTALDDLLGVPEEKVNDDRVYRALARLLPRKDALERHLRARLGELFALDYELLLYDVTSTYFEGEAAGHSSHRTPDSSWGAMGIRASWTSLRTRDLGGPTWLRTCDLETLQAGGGSPARASSTRWTGRDAGDGEEREDRLAGRKAMRRSGVRRTPHAEAAWTRLRRSAR